MKTPIPLERTGRHRAGAPGWFSALVAILLAGLALAGPAVAQTTGKDQRRAVLIVDGSGSMWGRLDNSNKITVARNALNAALVPFSGRVDLGLVYYGHRRKSDCRDVERALEPTRFDAATLERALAKFSPRGKTPTTTSIETAAEMLDIANSKADIVLLTDGAENCQRDPCATVRELRAGAYDLKVHVLALALKPEETAKTRCIATEGGGEYIEATNQAELEAGIGDLFSIIETGVPRQLAAMRAKEEAEANQAPGLRISAVFADGGPTAIDGVRWRVAKSGVDPDAVVFDGEGPVPRLDLPPGTYAVSARIGLVSIDQKVEVAARGTTDLLINLNSGSLRLSARSEANGPLLSDMFFSVFHSDAAGATSSSGQGRGAATTVRPLLVSRDAEAVYQLPAGSYRVVAEHGLARLERSVDVVAGRENVADFIIYAGDVTISAVAGSDNRPLEDLVYTIYEDDPSAEAGLRIVARSAAPRPTFTLPAGLYHVHVRHGAIEARGRVAVRPGPPSEVVLDINSGTLQLSSVLQGETTPLGSGLAWRIERLGSTGEVAELILRTARPTPEVQLTVGRYRVTGHYGPVNAYASVEVEIRPGRTQPLVLVQQAGVVQFQLAGATDSSALRDIYWELRGLNGVEIWATGQPAPEVPLGEGAYQIFAVARGKKAVQEFEIGAGERKIIEISTE